MDGWDAYHRDREAEALRRARASGTSREDETTQPNPMVVNAIATVIVGKAFTFADEVVTGIAFENDDLAENEAYREAVRKRVHQIRDATTAFGAAFLLDHVFPWSPDATATEDRC